MAESLSHSRSFVQKKIQVNKQSIKVKGGDIHPSQTCFRRATVHQVGAVGQDVGWVDPMKGPLLLEPGCSLLVQGGS